VSGVYSGNAEVTFGEATIAEQAPLMVAASFGENLLAVRRRRCGQDLGDDLGRRDVGQRDALVERDLAGVVEDDAVAPIR